MSKETINKIIGELDKVKTILQNINKTGHLPEIERDLILSKMRNIYEFLILIQPDFSSDDEIVKKEVGDTSKKSKPEDTYDVVKEVEKKEEVKPETTENVEVQLPKQEPYKIKEEILIEKFQSTGNFVHDALTRYVDTFDISKKLQNQPLKDIYSAIGLNDKFLFTKELFNDDMDLYKFTIDKLNHSGNFNDAIQYIDSNFKWDFENNAVQKLLELVRRRFPSEA
jgi:hypothetical protein